jgi:hypothetical protein
MGWFDLVACAMLVVGIRLLIREIQLDQRLRSIGIKVIGRIVHQRLRSGRGDNYFIPIARFTTQLGQVITIESAGHTIRPEFFDGDDVVPYYDPDQPALFLFAQELGRSRRYWFLALAMLLTLPIWLVIW